MFISILLISYLLITINSISIDLIEKDLNSSIEKLLLLNENLYVGTINSLHRLSSTTLNRNQNSLLLNSQLDESYHFKILLSINNNRLLLCGTTNQGTCQLIDEDFNLIINSSLPIVANDPINSTIGLIIPQENLIYFGVTYTNEGISRWQIPNLSGRSLNLTNFLKIYSINSDDETISRDDLSLRFMPRLQTTFIVQYIYSFYTENYIYFVTNQPNDIDQTQIITKLIRFCRKKSYSIIRSYSEIPLVCSNSEWIIQSAQMISGKNNQLILIGLFRKRDGSIGTNFCYWNVQNHIDKAFLDNYFHCYSNGFGQRGLNFIKPNESCRKDPNWSLGIQKDNICPWIISDRLAYPVGGINPIHGRIFYENAFENSSAFQVHSYGSINLFFQGLNNSTFKLGILDFLFNIKWIYTKHLSTQLPILSEILFQNQTATFFFASGSKIYRLSYLGDCQTRLSCDECLSSSNNLFCGWCSTIQRCTLENQCATNSWKQEVNQCIHITYVQPLNASIHYTQWINISLSKLPQLEDNQIYQCIFSNHIISTNTQAIKLDSNRISCPTPSNYFKHEYIHLQMGNETKVRLSIIKWPTNATIVTVPEFTFYNNSFESNEKDSSEYLSYSLMDPLNPFIEYGQGPIEIPLKFSNPVESFYECRLNETIIGFIHQNNICQFPNISEQIFENNQIVYLSIYDNNNNNKSVGLPIKLFVYRCDSFDSCHQCQIHSRCSWCQGKCLSKISNQCSINSTCTSLKIVDFHPKILPLNGDTLIRITLNELVNKNILQITLADIPCQIIKQSNSIECLSNRSNSSRQGLIKIIFENSEIIFSKQFIEYRLSSLISFSPLIVYELGGQILEIIGKYLNIGNSQQIFVGNFQCFILKQILTNNLTCRLPSIPSGFYNLSIIIDKQTVLTNGIVLRVTPNPIVQDINPLISFASGGRLITVRGMYFGSAQSILVEFSYRKWKAKLKINSNEIISSENGMISSFRFRSPSIPSPSNEFPSPPIDIHFSIYFDNLILLTNLIQFNYLSDILLNVSSNPPVLPYTGQELKLQVENLTDAASFEDIQLFIGCNQCKLKTFTSKGITCQPPNQLLTNTQISLNNQQHQVDCSIRNSSIGPIRFRIGFREYLIGYLSYIDSSSSSSSRYSVGTIVYLSLSSCLLTIALLTFGFCLYIKLKKCPSKTSSLSPIKSNEQNDKIFWSTTTTSDGYGPYYQVYEQISSTPSQQNTLTRAPLILCPYHHQHHYSKQDYSTLSFLKELKIPSVSLKTISIEHEQLKKLIYISTDIKSSSSNIEESMELFYDLLGMTPFSEAFIDQLIINNSNDLYKYYFYIYRYNKINLKFFPSTREITFYKLISSFLFQSKINLTEMFKLFDHLLETLINFLDSSPTDQLLKRSMNSLSSSTLLFLVKNYPYKPIELSINYENLFHFNLIVLDCDTIDQIKQKLIYQLNSYEKNSEQFLDLYLPKLNHCLYTYKIPMIKDYSINSTILCRKKSSILTNFKENQSFKYHLSEENQLINDQKLINHKLKENKNQLDHFLKNFYQEISKGLEGFSIGEKSNDLMNRKFYIQMISEFIRKLHLLIISRSTCPILQSCLNVIADGLEFIFQTKNQFSSEIEFLFEDDRKSFLSSDTNSFQIPIVSSNDSFLSSLDIRSIILNDQLSIQCLFKLYQFYELHSESINQHIGENHVSVLLPVHHLLVKIRQLINSDPITTRATSI